MRTLAAVLLLLTLSACEAEETCELFDAARGCPCDGPASCRFGDVCTRAGVCAEILVTPAERLPGWVWDFPNPSGQRPLDVFASAPDDVWVAGVDGLLLHGDGFTWEVVDETVATLRAIDGAASDDVWAVGDGTALHWDGSTWSETSDALVERSVLVDVWAAGDGAAVALGNDRLLAFDGEWTEVVRLPPGLFALEEWGAKVTGSAPDDLWFVGLVDVEFFADAQGPEPVLVHWDGVSFEQYERGRLVVSVVSASRTDATAIAGDGAIGTWDGTAWRFTAAETPEVLEFSADRALDGTLWAMSSDDVIKAWDGQRWSELMDASTLRFGGINSFARVVSADVAYAALDDGGVARFDREGSGGAWHDPWQRLPPITDVVVVDDEAWAVGFDGVVAHWTGAAWGVTRVGDESLHAIVTRAPGDLWIAAEGAVLHGDGSTWSRVALPEERLRLLDLWAPQTGDVWGIGVRLSEAGNSVIGSFVVRGGVNGFTIVEEFDESIRAVWGRGESDVWIAGSNTLRRLDGEGFRTVLRFGGGYLFGASRFVHVNDNEAWLVGSNGLLLHYSGGDWQDVSLGTSITFHDGFAIAPNDVWLVGDRGTLAHWDGSLWTSSRAFEGGFRAIAGGRTRMWMVGTDGSIAHAAP